MFLGYVALWERYVGGCGIGSWLQTDGGDKAGSGKTILSSLVIDTLTETYKPVPTIYFYCNYGESKRRETVSIIASLLKQLLASRRCDDCDPEMVTIFDDGSSLDAGSSESLFAAALSRFEQVFVVVDALDECSEEERKSMVMLLIRLLKSNTSCNMKVFLTSRPENDLSNMLENNPSYQIDANDTSKDITPFVAAALDEHIMNRALLGGHVSLALRKELIEKISVQADGMYGPLLDAPARRPCLILSLVRFLWAKLQLDNICKQGNEVEVRAQLMKLPRGLDRTYDQIWAKINDGDSTERRWASKTLKWVLQAKEPLRPEEILEATALEPFDTTLDTGRMALSVGYLIHVCGNFIALDLQANRLRFVHYSVQEFLGKNEEFHSAEDLLAEVCLTVLGHSDAGRAPVLCNDYQGQAGSGKYLYEYAARHWVTHCKSWGTIDNRRGKLIEQFLWNPPAWNNWVKSGFVPLSPYEVASRYNLPIILQHLLQPGLHNDDFAEGHWLPP